MKKIIVKNNITGDIKEFDLYAEAIKYQEHLIFDLGIDSEVL